MRHAIPRRTVLALLAGGSSLLAGCEFVVEEAPYVTVANRTDTGREVGVRVVARASGDELFASEEGVPAGEFVRHPDALPRGVEGDLLVTVTVDAAYETQEQVHATDSLVGVQITVFGPSEVSLGAVVE